MRQVEHVVIGAGLAGLVSGHFLRSRNIVIIDSSPGGYKIGESIIPEVFRHPEMRKLLPDVLSLPSHTRKWGTTFMHEDEVSAFPLAPDEAERSMHIFRSEMEELLRETWGVEVTKGFVRAVDLEGRTVTTDDEVIRFTGMIIDCSGPSMVLARLLGEVEDVLPLHARWRYFNVADASDDAFAEAMAAEDVPVSLLEPRLGGGLAPDSEWRVSETTVLRRAQDGVWCWQIPLYDGEVLSFGVVSRHGPVSRELYEETVATATAPCFELQARPEGPSPLDREHVRDCMARRARRAAGERFVLVGDAYAFSDPVYSVGTGFAVNQAIQVCEQLLEGGWNADIAAGFSKNAEQLHRRARKAFELWYAGDVAREEGASETVQNDMLRGGLFQEALIEEYGAVLNDSDLSSHVEPFQPRAGAAPVTAAVTGLIPSAGWRMEEAMPCAGGLRLKLGLPDASSLVLLVHKLEQDTPFFLSAGNLAISYRDPDGKWNGQALESLCAPVRDAIQIAPEQWSQLLELS